MSAVLYREYFKDRMLKSLKILRTILIFEEKPRML